MNSLTNGILIKNLNLQPMFSRKLAYTFILFTLVVFKVSSATLHFHTVHQCDEHEREHKDHCEDCDTFLNLVLDEFSATISIQLPSEASRICYDPKITLYRRVVIEASFTCSLSIRPPPLPISIV